MFFGGTVNHKQDQSANSMRVPEKTRVTLYGSKLNHQELDCRCFFVHRVLFTRADMLVVEDTGTALKQVAVQAAPPCSTVAA